MKDSNGIRKKEEPAFVVKKYEKKNADFLKKSWMSEIRKPEEHAHFSGQELPVEIKLHPQFIPIVSYIMDRYENILHYVDLDSYDELDRELLYYERQGQLCVYLSIVTFALFLKHNVCDDRHLRYVQGYYYHKTRTDNPIASLLGDEHAGSHAWVVIGKSVIDISIKQEELFFDFGGQPYILGTVPEGLTFKGFAEPRKVVNKYIEKFAKRSGISPAEWIERHQQKAESTYLNLTNEEFEKRYKSK